MFASRALTSAIVVGAVAIGSVFAAAPASAATLPSGQQITVIDSFEWQFYEASPVDASLTAVGAMVPFESDYITGVDVNDDGIGYAVATFDEGGGYLYNADANTGTLSNDILITFNFGDVFPDADECTAIDYTDGVIVAACQLYGDFDATYVGTVDPATGVLTPIVELAGVEDFLYITAIAIDPISGLFYAVAYDFEAIPQYTLWTLDEVTGATFVTGLSRAAFGADFDRDGQLWVTSEVAIGGGEFPPVFPVLATLNTTDGTNPFFEPFTLAGVPLDIFIDPITVWGKEALAETGVTQNPAVGVGAAAILLFGALMAAGAMAMRRRSVES